MAERVMYEVVEADRRWVLRRAGWAPLVEFRTEGEAVRAGLAVCRDEGLSRLVIRRGCGGVEEIDLRVSPAAFEV